MSQDPSTPSDEYLQMEAARHIPRLLDSSRPDGGVMRLLTEPGGRPGTVIERNNIVADARAPDGRRAELESVSFQRVETVPLLLQHMVEDDADFAMRSMLAAPRGSYWHACKALAGRPFSRAITFSQETPKALKEGGAYAEDLDGLGNSMAQVASHLVEGSVGYGLNYALIEERGGRGVVREIPASSIVNVRPGPDGSPLLMVAMVSETSYDGDVTSPTSKKEVKPLCMVFHRGDPDARDDNRYAWYEVYRPKSKGDAFSETPGQVPDPTTGELVDRVRLAPHETIPLEPMPSGRLTAAHFILPKLLPAAKLEHLLLQVTSNAEFATLLANAPLRFAKGIPDHIIKQWRTVGPQIFYATPSENADMKWVTLPAEALKAGMDLADLLVRAVEVEGLAPMMTRSTGDERALGMALASSRARSAAELFAVCWSSALTRIWRRLAMYESRKIDPSKIVVQLNGDFGSNEQDMATAQHLARLYLDPSRDMPRSVFYAEMLRLGILGDKVDMDAIAKWAEEPGRDLRVQELNLRKAEILRDMAVNGLFTGPGNRLTLYRALQELGLTPEGFIPEEAAAEDASNGLLSSRNLATLRDILGGDL